jgi:uncharacterized protein
MDFLYVHFPVSGVATWVFIPPLVAFAVSFFTSMGGVSGALLLLPFQVSFLGYGSPSVSGTNHVFNVVAIPSGVYRYMREKRMVWPLAWAVVIGTLPGVVIGSWLRVSYLADLRKFKLFVGAVLLYVGLRLAREVFFGKGEKALAKRGEKPAAGAVSETRFSLRRVEFRFGGQGYAFSPPGVFLLSLAIGVVGGIYGVGGGALVAPFFVILFKMPIHLVAGAALLGAFINSLGGAAFFQALSWGWDRQVPVAPDWLLGALFGAGGVGGMYCGARAQKYFPGRAIKGILCACVLLVAVKYIADFF